MFNDSVLDKNSPLSSLALMGGKAKNLYIMESHNFSVPDWCCISSDVFSYFFDQIKKDIIPLIDSIDINDLNKIQNISSRVSELFDQVVFPKEIIEQTLKKLGEYQYFAVRSSALSEDGDKSSFAGQLSTFLYVKEIDLEKYIKSCWASIFSARALQYNLVNGIDISDQKVAVIIQKMIDSEKSGVLFSVDPTMSTNFYHKTVINAGYGLGEGIVTDKVETDLYIYDLNDKKIIKSEYSEKKTRLIMGENGGLKEDNVPSNLTNASVLNHKNISELVSTSTLLSKYYDHEIDMEWAYDSSGKLYITQVRPITTLTKSFIQNEVIIDNSNVVESFPGVNTPWTISIIRDVYKTVFSNASARIGISKNKIDKHSYVFQHLIASYKGRVFYNLTNWYAMMRLVPYTEKYIKVWERMLGITRSSLSMKKKQLVESLFYNPFRVLVILSKITWIFLKLDKYLSKLDRKLKKNFHEVWQKKQSGLYLGYGPSDFMIEIEEFKQTVFTDWDITLINDIYAFVCTATTKRILKKLKIENVDNFFNDLLYGISGMESVAPVKSIVAMALIVKEDEQLKENLIGLIKANESNINILNTTVNEINFVKLFKYHLNEFGDRGVEELKLETITHREDPVLLLDMIIQYAQAPIESLASDQNDGRRFKATKELNKKLLRHPMLKLLMPFFQKMAIRSINYRENFRLHRARGYGVVRMLTNELGNKLQNLDLIDDNRDIYYLDYDELFRATHALEFSNDLKQLVNVRKKVFHSYEREQAAFRYKFDSKSFYPFEENIQETEDLVGQACSSGIVEGEVIVIDDVKEIGEDASLVANKILVAKMTDPGWVYLMTVSKGLIVEKGSILSHTAIIGRELGIPTIVGVKKVTQKLKTGDRIKMDGQTGKIIYTSKN